MDDIIEQEGQKRRSELEVLQSQINPHFLYNTLDSVIWMTEAGRYEEAIQMVTSLGPAVPHLSQPGKEHHPPGGRVGARPPLYEYPANTL